MKEKWKQRSMISCQRSKSTFWKRISAPAKNVPSTPIGSAGFSIMQEEMNFQLWNIRRLRFWASLDSLKSENRVLDWQHRQANDSIRLYYFHYLNKTDARSVKKLMASDSMSENNSRNETPDSPEALFITARKEPIFSGLSDFLNKPGKRQKSNHRNRRLRFQEFP